jgi:hypothetical protein
MIVRYADRYAGSDRPYANANILRKGRRRNDADHGDSNSPCPILQDFEWRKDTRRMQSFLEVSTSEGELFTCWRRDPSQLARPV